jgi:hypothetical protein
MSGFRTRVDAARVWAWFAVFVGGLVAVGVSLGRVWVYAGGPVMVPAHWSLIRSVGAVLILVLTGRAYAVTAWPPGVGWWLWHRIGALVPILVAGLLAWHETAGHIGWTVAWFGELWPIAGYGLVLVGSVTLAGRRRYYEETSAAAAAAVFSALDPDLRGAGVRGGANR